jgi:hypothetical protein
VLNDGNCTALAPAAALERRSSKLNLKGKTGKHFSQFGVVSAALAPCAVEKSRRHE